MIVKLLKAHEDAGKKYPAGEEIDVNEPTAEWLAANKVISPLATAIKKAPAAAQESRNVG